MERGVDQASWNARNELERTRRLYFSAAGTISEAQLFAAADSYRRALSEYKARTKKNFRVPTRTELLR